MLNKRLRIGVTMRILEARGYYEPRDALAHDWSSFLRVALSNAAWLPLPNLGANSIRVYCEKWGINRLILTGGNDIGVSPIRDETEQDLLSWARENAVPVLGICRGMQVMAMWVGAELKPVAGHVRTRHQLAGEITGEVNSYHNDALAECPPGFTVLARSEDDEIEAIRHESLPWEGWMWHPEREENFHSRDIERLRALFA